MNKRIVLIITLIFLIFAIFLTINSKRSVKNTDPIVIVDKGGKTPIEIPQVIVPEFIAVPVASLRISEDSLYADIINHSRKPVIEYDRDTDAHETTHMINSDLRNANRGSNGFYIPGGRGVIIKEPGIRKKDLIPFIPENLRSYRYPTYITGQTAWDDLPLYVFDEWVAYVNGAAVSVEDVEKGRHDGQWSDAVSGCLGFSIYAVSLAMAVEKKDPEYWNNNEQFKSFLHWHLKRSYDIFQKGRYMDEFIWDKQEMLYANLLNDPAAAPIRNFLKKHFNGLWLDGHVIFRYGPIPEFKRFHGATKIIDINGVKMGIKHE